MKLFKTVVTIGAGLSLVAWCFLLSQSSNAAARAPRTTSIPSALNTWSIDGWNPAGRGYQISQAYSFNSGGTVVRMRWNERETPSGPLYTHDREDSTSFPITAVGTREGGNELYLAGTREDGTTVIKKFKYKTRDGGYSLVSANAPSFIGVPRPPHTWKEVLNGTQWHVPGQDEYKAPDRKTIYASTSLGWIQDMVVDPDGRYLLLLGYPGGEIYQLNLTVSPPFLSLLFDQSDLPELDSAGLMQISEHVTEGRKVVITGAAEWVNECGFIMLGDANNDGVFESIVRKSYQQAYDEGYFRPDGASWTYYFLDLASY